MTSNIKYALEYFHADDERVINNRHRAAFGVEVHGCDKKLRYGSMTIAARKIGEPYDMPEFLESYALDRAAHYNKVMPRKRRADQ